MATGVWAVDVSPVHSVFTGITTAYLFLKLFPELGVEVGRDLGLDGSAELLRRLVYAFALLGLTAFYAAEVWAHRGTAHRARPMRDERVYHLLLVPFALGAAAFGIVLLLVERFAP